MRAMILALLVAAGVGLMGASNASAAPANGVTINDSANLNNSVIKVQHWRWRSRHAWRRCHYRHRSGWYRCRR
ncbi:MAG: hypothetical protein ACREB8_18070 [Pseudolabrys sp.]